MVCRNICLKTYSKIIVGQSHYSLGKKYCRRCECYFITQNIFCECCGMQLRGTPAERECKEKLNRKIKRKRKRSLKHSDKQDKQKKKSEHAKGPNIWRPFITLLLQV